MARLIGDNLLPNSVVTRRRQMRERVRDLRQPIRNKREQFVPGPDVVSTVEEQVIDFRNQIVSRESVIERIKARRSDSSGGGSSGSSGGSSDGSENVQQMT